MRGLALLALPSLAVGAGCQDYLFERKCPEAVTQAEQSVEVGEPVPADILFVIDNSGSMADEQENLVRNFQTFIDVLANSDLDYRIAVVTTDLGNDADQITRGPEQAGIAGFAVDESSPYRAVDTGDRSDCRTLDDVPHGCFRSSRAEPWIDSQRDDPSAVVRAFRDTARVGTCGSGFERGSRAMLEALENTAPGGCNAGFLRPDANLVVIVVTDEDDFRPLATDETLGRLSEVKPLEQVRFALIGGIVDGMPSTCRTGPSDEAIAMCGSLCDMDRPMVVDRGPCGRNGQCPQFFECAELNGRARCVNVGYVGFPNLGTGFGCDSCSSFDVEDCCAADVGAQRYYDLATALESRLSQRDPSFAADGCQGESEMGRAVCLVDSICQGEFADTLRRIAQELVVSTTVRLSEPASYPPGVVARLTGGRYADAPRELVNCQAPEADAGACDFDIVDDGQTLELQSADALPRPDENLEVFFTIENPDPPRADACGDI
jgi:hypothetical protein